MLRKYTISRNFGNLQNRNSAAAGIAIRFGPKLLLKCSGLKTGPKYPTIRSDDACKSRSHSITTFNQSASHSSSQRSGGVARHSGPITAVWCVWVIEWSSDGVDLRLPGIEVWSMCCSLCVECDSWEPGTHCFACCHPQLAADNMRELGTHCWNKQERHLV